MISSQLSAAYPLWDNTFPKDFLRGTFLNWFFRYAFHTQQYPTRACVSFLRFFLAMNRTFPLFLQAITIFRWAALVPQLFLTRLFPRVTYTFPRARLSSTSYSFGYYFPHITQSFQAISLSSPTSQWFMRKLPIES